MIKVILKQKLVDQNRRKLKGTNVLWEKILDSYIQEGIIQLIFVKDVNNVNITPPNVRQKNYLRTENRNSSSIVKIIKVFQHLFRQKSLKKVITFIRKDGI